MAPSALWIALVVELQLWVTGDTVPAKVGDSWGHGGQLRITKCPSQLLHNSGTAREAIPSPADTRHASLGTHWGPETWHVGSLGWYSVPNSLMFQKYPVALSASLVRARIILSQAQEHCSVLRSLFCPAVWRWEGRGATAPLLERVASSEDFRL